MVKFGEKLLQKANSSDFLDYEKLRALIVLVVKAQSADENARQSNAFFDALKAELAKVNAYFLSKRAALTEALHELAEELQAAQRSGASTPLTASPSAIAVLDEVDAFVSFVSLNYMAAVRILEKLDRKAGSQTRTRFVADVLDVQPFCQQPLSELVERASRCRVAYGLKPPPAADDSDMHLRAFAASSPGSSGSSSTPASSFAADPLTVDLNTSANSGLGGGGTGVNVTPRGAASESTTPRGGPELAHATGQSLPKAGLPPGVPVGGPALLASTPVDRAVGIMAHSQSGTATAAAVAAAAAANAAAAAAAGAAGPSPPVVAPSAPAATASPPQVASGGQQPSPPDSPPRHPRAQLDVNAPHPSATRAQSPGRSLSPTRATSPVRSRSPGRALMHPFDSEPASAIVAPTPSSATAPEPAASAAASAVATVAAGIAATAASGVVPSRPSPHGSAATSPSPPTHGGAVAAAPRPAPAVVSDDDDDADPEEDAFHAIQASYNAREEAEAAAAAAAVAAAAVKVGMAKGAASQASEGSGGRLRQGDSRQDPLAAELAGTLAMPLIEPGPRPHGDFHPITPGGPREALVSPSSSMQSSFHSLPVVAASTATATGGGGGGGGGGVPASNGSGTGSGSGSGTVASSPRGSAAAAAATAALIAAAAATAAAAAAAAAATHNEPEPDRMRSRSRPRGLPPVEAVRADDAVAPLESDPATAVGLFARPPAQSGDPDDAVTVQPSGNGGSGGRTRSSGGEGTPAIVPISVPTSTPVMSNLNNGGVRWA